MDLGKHVKTRRIAEPQVAPAIVPQKEPVPVEVKP